MEKPPIFTLITIKEWKFIVVKVKKRSALSIFSYFNYAICKCAIGSDRMNKILIKYYNLIIKQYHFLSRWLKILDIMIEKVKEPIVGKLRTIQLIEANL